MDPRTRQLERRRSPRSTVPVQLDSLASHPQAARPGGFLFECGVVASGTPIYKTADGPAKLSSFCAGARRSRHRRDVPLCLARRWHLPLIEGRGDGGQRVRAFVPDGGGPPKGSRIFF